MSRTENASSANACTTPLIRTSSAFWRRRDIGLEIHRPHTMHASCRVEYIMPHTMLANASSARASATSSWPRVIWKDQSFGTRIGLRPWLCGSESSGIIQTACPSLLGKKIRLRSWLALNHLGSSRLRKHTETQKLYKETETLISQNFGRHHIHCIHHIHHIHTCMHACTHTHTQRVAQEN